MTLYLLPSLTMLALLLAAAGIYQFQVRNRRIADRLKRVVEGEDPSTPGVEFVSSSVPAGLKPIAFLGWLLPGQIYSETLKWDLAQGGFNHREARRVFTGMRVLSTVVFGLAGALTTWLLRLPTKEMFFLSLLAIAIGFYLPVSVLRMRQNRRRQEIMLSLPDALDLLVICVEAGQGLNAALLKVGRECELHAKALSDELRIVNNEMRAGIARETALRNFSLRSGVDDVRALVAVMIQTDRFGTSIAKALRTHAASLRTRRRQRAEETARKCPVKLVFPLVFCIFPEILVVIMAPGMLQLFRGLANATQGG